MNVNDVILSAPEDLLELFLEIDADRESSVGAMNENWLAAPQSNDVRIGGAAFDGRRDDVDVMTEAAGLARKEVHMLANAAEMRIVILGDQCNPERPRECRRLSRQRRCREQVET